MADKQLILFDEKNNKLPRPKHAAALADPMLEIPELVRPVFTPATARLVSCLRWEPALITKDMIPSAIDALDKLMERFRTYSQPATEETILEVLRALSETIQVKLPSSTGRKIYVAILQELPAAILQLAMHHVMRTHAFKSLPLPADFLKSEPAVEWQTQSRWVPILVNKWKTELNERRTR